VLVFCILTELRESATNIVHEKLRQFFVGLEHEAKELAVVVVHHI
jgi:hypothetical protein